MARHASVSRTDRNAVRKQQMIGQQLSKMVGECKALRFKDYDRLLADAERDIGIRQRLNADVDAGGEKAVVARRKLRELRDVKYYVDKAPAAGELHNEPGKAGHKARPARGSTGKHQNLLRGQAARNSQGKGI